MQIIKGSRNLKGIDLKNPVITLGNFDGVHLGHQKILKKTIQQAKAISGMSAVYTFNPHPLNVLQPEQEPLKITTFEEKVQIIESIGIDYLICDRFTKRFSEKSPEEFIKTIIWDRIHPREIIVGHDYAFGKNRKGAIELLKKMGEEFHYRIHVVSDITIKNIPVRSTTIRNLIASGKVSLAQKLLGRHYSLSGKIVHGKHRKIGFPTANLSHIKDLIPKDGVYAIRIATPYGKFDGVINIGFNPTFEVNKLCIEAHIFDFNKNLFGKEITIFFVKRIRDEKKFKDAKSLAGQIDKDIEFAKKVLEKNKIYD
jgi:riboflavin kinase/FMN adenylyltransferase